MLNIIKIGMIPFQYEYIFYSVEEPRIIIIHKHLFHGPAPEGRLIDEKLQSNTQVLCIHPRFKLEIMLLLLLPS